MNGHGPQRIQSGRRESSSRCGFTFLCLYTFTVVSSISVFGCTAALSVLALDAFSSRHHLGHCGLYTATMTLRAIGLSLTLRNLSAIAQQQHCRGCTLVMFGGGISGWFCWEEIAHAWLPFLQYSAEAYEYTIRAESIVCTDLALIESKICRTYPFIVSEAGPAPPPPPETCP